MSKVKIKKSTTKKSWYSDHIGETFDILLEFSNVFIVSNKHLAFRLCKDLMVLKSDCVKIGGKVSHKVERFIHARYSYDFFSDNNNFNDDIHYY